MQKNEVSRKINNQLHLLLSNPEVQHSYGIMKLWMQESISRTKECPLELLGILTNMFRNTRLHNDILESLEQVTVILSLLRHFMTFILFFLLSSLSNPRKSKKGAVTASNSFSVSLSFLISIGFTILLKINSHCRLVNRVLCSKS